VHWLTVGQMINSQGQVDNGKLLSKLQTIILRLDKNKTYRPPNVEAATDYLQQVSPTTCTLDILAISLNLNLYSSTYMYMYAYGSGTGV
jgi:hypothetical protein